MKKSNLQTLRILAISGLLKTVTIVPMIDCPAFNRSLRFMIFPYALFVVE